MNFKNLPYWLKGGIIGILVWGMPTVALIPLGRPSSIFAFPYWIYPSLIAVIPFERIIRFFEYFFGYSYFYDSLITKSPISLLISAILFCFIFGAAIGLIYRKITKN